MYLPKNPKSFSICEKNGIYVIAISNFYSSTKFEIDTFFGQVIRKKLFKIDDVKFSNSILAILDHLAQNKDHH